MNARHHGLPLLLALVLGACAGSEEADAETSASRTQTTGAEVEETPAEDAPAADVPEGGRTYAANPLLNVYVQGPDPAPGEALEGEAPDEYRASIVVTNTGDAPVGVEYAHIHFELWHRDEMVACQPDDRSVLLEGPAQLGPGEAHTYQATLECDLPGAGEFEVRAYMSFGAEAPTFERERHYVGAYRVRAP
ncbi:MAG TPA: hypothetical protein RMH99_16640 [Sandaracinaceae bacterium LLY-WYZ-13_1]|nr:hypothetical protein [Sandaracinaceae bacterium LLY-WYZ-13_1]